MRPLVVTLAFLVGWLSYPAALLTSDDDGPIAKKHSQVGAFVASAHAQGAEEDADLITVW